MNKIRLAMISALALAAGCALAQTPKVVAHRGYWNTEGSSQNSIRSIVKADSVGCYASEFDVWMTADSVLVVNHDATINGHIIETTDSKTILSQQLSNGEFVPTLEQYLKAASGLKSRIVCELKTHDSRATEQMAVKEIVDMVGEYGLADRTDYIAFSPEAFTAFIKAAPKGCGVYYLTGDYVPAQIKAMGGAGIDYSLRTMKRHPEWIEEAHALGLLVNIWTVNAEDDMRWCIDHGADFITTNEPELLQSILNDK